MLQRRPSARSTTVMRGGAAGSGRPAAQATSVPLMMSSLAPPLSSTEKRRPVTRPTPHIRGLDLVTGRRFSVDDSGGASELIISGTLVAWAAGRPDPAAPPLITVVDLADGRRWSIAPYPQNQGSDLLGIALAGRTLIWARATAARADQILAYDLDRTAVRAIAQAAD